MKEDKRVLRELDEKLNGPVNIPCRIEKFGNVVEEFCPRKRQWVSEMGFGSMFYLVDHRLPRSLCYWLATCVDVDNKEFVSSNGLVFPLSKI